MLVTLLKIKEYILARFQLEISEESLEEIEALVAKTGTSTKKEFINYAITLLKWAIKQSESGNIIASINEKEGRYKELEMPILDHVRPRQPYLTKVK